MLGFRKLLQFHEDQGREFQHKIVSPDFIIWDGFSHPILTSCVVCNILKAAFPLRVLHTQIHERKFSKFLLVKI